MKTDNKISFTDENGKVLSFNIEFTFDYKGSQYVICSDENDDWIPFKYNDDGDAYIIDDEDEMNELTNYVNSMDNFDKIVEDNDEQK